MLSAYPKLPRVIAGVDRVISESALRSFYEQSGAFGQAERMLGKIQIRTALDSLLCDMKGATQSLTEEERIILERRFFSLASTPEKGERQFSKSTYYRRLKRAIQKVENYLLAQNSEQRYYLSGLNETTFFRYLSGHIKEMRRKQKEGNCPKKAN